MDMDRVQDRWRRRRDAAAGGDVPAGGRAHPAATPAASPPAPSEPSRQEWEYVVVMLPHKAKGRDREWTTALNDVAAEGWRLVTIASEQNPYGGSHYAALERRRPGA